MLCENYLLNKEVNPGPFDVDTFKSIQPLLDRIDNIHCLETQLYSDHLQVAGTVDCIAEFDGRMSVIDFKTSKRIKSRDDIHSYFMQTSAYAVMFEERTGIVVDRLAILMSVDDEQPLLFIEKRDEWVDRFIEVRKDYSKMYNL
jgi:genome maintenance exonuclease 1